VIGQVQLSALPEDAGLPNAYLGEGLPEDAERHLQLAGLSYHLGDVAETHLLEAQAAAPDHVGVLIGLYRFYFYKGQFEQALDIAVKCLKKAARENNFPANWRDTEPREGVFDRYEDMRPRFFLFTLKGYAYLQMRLGNLDEGLAAVEKLLELDPSDKIGAKVLLEIIQRARQADDE
jgi:tetratricopeptide (TPR) repeat protein